MSQSDGEIELVFEPVSERFDAGDDRWIDQKNSLLTELRRDVGEVRKQEAAPEPGHKGGAAAAIILALGSSGAIAAAVTVFKAWLARDRTRMIRVTRTVGEQTIVEEYSANSLSEEAFVDFIKSRG